MKILLIALLPVALAACTHGSWSGDMPVFPKVKVAPPGLDQVWLTAGMSGKLVVENGCVKLRGPRGGKAKTILWYEGIELDRDEKGLFLRNTFTGGITRFNEPAGFGGGGAPEEFVVAEYPEVARRCGGPYAFGYPGR